MANKQKLKEIQQQLAALTAAVIEALDDGDEVSAEPQPKKKRGRPRKTEAPPPEKKKRGRPKKVSAKPQPTKRGRPRSTKIVEEHVPARAGGINTRSAAQGKRKMVFLGDGIAKAESVKKNPRLGTTPQAVLQKRSPATSVKLMCAICGNPFTMPASIVPRPLGKDHTPTYRCDNCCRGG